MHRYLNINRLLGDTFGLWLSENNRGTFNGADALEESVTVTKSLTGEAPYGMPVYVPVHQLTATNVVIDRITYPTLVFNISLSQLIQLALEEIPVAPANENFDTDPAPAAVNGLPGYTVHGLPGYGHHVLSGVTTKRLAG